MPPFGSVVGREYEADTVAGYLFGFNGKENDEESGTQDYGMRIYNPSLGRFLSVDPLTRSYAMLTPYQFASNTPLAAIDLDGLEAFILVETTIRTSRGNKITSSAYYKEVYKDYRANKDDPNSDFTCLILKNVGDISQLSQPDLSKIAERNKRQIQFVNTTANSLRKAMAATQQFCATNVGVQQNSINIGFSNTVTFDYKDGQTEKSVKSKFESSESTLTEIDNMAAILVNNPNAKIDIMGMASKTGILDNNKIAKNRAEAGKAYLMSYIKENYKGATIDESRINISSDLSNKTSSQKNKAAKDKSNQGIKFTVRT